jgi:hypothetical protein
MPNTPIPDTTLDDVVPYEATEIPVTPAAITVPVQEEYNIPGAIASPVPSATEPNATTEAYSPENSAAGQVTSLLDENSAYIQQARRAGERSVQAKGLFNSSLSAEASQAAAMDRAAPIVLADAATYAAADLSSQKAMETDYINYRNTKLQGLISSGLSAQEAEASLVLDDQQQAGANYRAELERNMGLNEFAASDREAASTAMTNFGFQFQKDVSAIQLDKDTSAADKTAKMEVARQVYESNMQNTAALYDIELTWSMPFGDTGSASAASTSAATASIAAPATTSAEISATNAAKLEADYIAMQEVEKRRNAQDK